MELEVKNDQKLRRQIIDSLNEPAGMNSVLRIIINLPYGLIGVGIFLLFFVALFVNNLISAFSN